MKARLRAALLAAATLVVGGVALITTALDSARSGLQPAMSCAEWDRAVAELFAPADYRWFFVGVASGTNPPAAFRAANGIDYPLGDCAAGTCTIGPGSCTQSISWSYQVSAAVNGRRIVATKMPAQLALAWKKWASEAPGVVWLGSWSELVTACVAAHAAADCRTMINDLNPCWRRNATTWCRNGRLYGAGAGGTATCTVQAGDLPIACDTSHGAGGEEAERNTSYSDADLQ